MQVENAPSLLATVEAIQRVRLLRALGSRGPMIDSRHMFLIGLSRSRIESRLFKLEAKKQER